MNVCISIDSEAGKIASVRAIAAGSWRPAAFSLALALLIVTGAHAQSGAVCPGHKALTLAQVQKYIEEKVSEESTVQRIESCQVTFSLDAPSLDALVSLGVTSRVLDVLNRMTATQLTPAQAQSEVQGLERHIEEMDNALIAQRDAALQKLDSDYKTLRERADHVDPKGQFESTADYNARVRQNGTALTAMDAKHESDRDQLAASFAAQAGEKALPYRARETFLKQRMYADSRPLTYVSYNADTGQLIANLGEEVYWFEKVPSSTAQALYKNWKQVKVTQSYEDDRLHGRVLGLEDASASVSGYSHTAKMEDDMNSHNDKIASLLTEGPWYMGRHDYAAAAKAYRSVLALDANNDQAKAGIAAVEVAQKKWNALRAEEFAAGGWVDENSQLMWTWENNGRDVDWDGALKYCNALRTGGFSDWRLPSTQELYAPSLLSMYSGGTNSRWPVPDYKVSDYSGFWSGTGRSGDFAQALVRPAVGGAGISEKVPAKRSKDMRAVCVRHYVRPEP